MEDFIYAADWRAVLEAGESTALALAGGLVLCFVFCVLLSALEMVKG